MLRSDQDRADDEVPVKPCVDPTFRKSPSTYASFLKEIFGRGLLRFGREADTRSSIGIFFVKKKGDRQRIILDTRRCNQHFVKPPTTRLPTPGAVSH